MFIYILKNFVSENIEYDLLMIAAIYVNYTIIYRILTKSYHWFSHHDTGQSNALKFFNRL